MKNISLGLLFMLILTSCTGTFSAGMEGVSGHGNMICYKYHGNSVDLVGLEIKANISQGSTMLESEIPSQYLDDGRSCFEMIDGLYTDLDLQTGLITPRSGDIKVQINAFSSDGEIIETTEQELVLGEYRQVPLLDNIYFTNRICGTDGGELWHKDYFAWDFMPSPSSENQTSVNTPVRAPIEGYLYVFKSAATGNGFNYSIIIYSPQTGYLVVLVHNADSFIDSDGEWISLLSLSGKYVHAGEIIAGIGETDSESYLPHTHMQVMIIPDVDITGDQSDQGEMLWEYYLDPDYPTVDFVTSRLLIDKFLNLFLLIEPDGNCWGFDWDSLQLPPQPAP